ncbi:hypothetical protein E8L99_04845 [Phreatobacter aquaticus]|uniref:Periplasmic protein-like protein n=1 Tax=Phreatobacter aquaticus TaxID=2570229 RepID=A0A4D7QHI7_9HYPH|nr:hypothetical protein [Phreatobacter aquaticus]QCK85153.1 hypothetical protein E8L99_04845 [Phreatobacter aquaticus]
MRMIQNNDQQALRAPLRSSGRTTFKRGLLAAIAALSLGAPLASAATPATSPPAETASEPGQRVSMDFRIVEGRGLFGLTRWIQASGPITADTADRFDQFARANRIAGMTVVLDSPGGSMTSGLRMGRAFRAAGVNTMIGRTVIRLDGGQESATLLTHGMVCASACSYALLGGVHRTIASTARYGVHQFSRNIGRDGRFVTEQPTVRDFESAQRLMAELAVYLQEMGIDAGLLPLAASMPHGQQIRFLTPAEIGGLRVAVPAVVNEADRGTVGWSANHRADAPMLFSRAIRPLDGERRVDEEVALTCHRDPAQVIVNYRVIQARTRDSQPLKLGVVNIDLAGTQVPWRPAAAAPAPELRGSNTSLWISIAVPRQALEQAGERNALAIELGEGASPQGRTDFGAGLGNALPRFLTACDAGRPAATAGR